MTATLAADHPSAPPAVRPSRAAAAGAVALILMPLAFVLWAWAAANGWPYFMDSNESTLSYVHAVNLRRFPASETLFLTFDDLGRDDERPVGVYAHNPNLPRYVHLGLLLAGIEPLRAHILIISLAGTLAALLLVRAVSASLAPGGSLALLLPVALALDSMGFLTWAVNTYRVLAFVLLWGALLVAVRPAPGWVAFVVGFLVFHYEYAFALFASVALCIVAVARDGRAAWRMLAWYGAGAGLSLLVFGAQVVGYYGPAGALDQMLRTASRRGATVGLGEALAAAWAMVLDRYGAPITLAVAWSLATAPLVLLPASARRLGSPRVGLAQLQLGLALGCLATAVVLRGFFVDGYVRHFLPCLVFPVVVGVATVAADVGTAVGALSRRLATPAAFAVVGLLMVGNVGAVFARYPLLAPDLAPLLEGPYRGRSFVGLPYNVHLAFALGRGPSAVGPEDLAAQDLAPYERLRGPDGRLYYLCIDPWTRGPVCDRAAIVYGGQGHAVRERGADWAIIELRR